MLAINNTQQAARSIVIQHTHWISNHGQGIVNAFFILIKQGAHHS